MKVTYSVPNAMAMIFILFFSRTAFGQASVNLALQRPVYASSSHDNLPANADDGSTTTAWQSDYTDAEWIYTDLGTNYSISRIHLVWDTAYGKDYEVQISDDAENWVTVQTVTGNTSLDNDFTNLSINARYVRMYGIARGSVSGSLSGYYLAELEVYSFPDPPLVIITSPGNNTYQNYTNTPLLTATADAFAATGKTITKVEFYSGNTLIGSDTSLPYALDLSALDEGTHVLTAKAYDNANAVDISEPVVLSLNAVSANPCTAAAWNTSTVYSSAGMLVTYLGRAYENRYYTVGQDPLNNSGDYKVWQLVSTCGTGTAVTITSPSNNDTSAALASYDIHVNALANAPYRITKVDLYANTTLIDSDTSAFFNFNWNQVPAGNYALKAVAYDNAGVTTTSSIVNVAVIAGTGCNAPAWTSSTIYSTVGEQVTYQGKVYTNKWYSSGQNPATNSGQYQVWTLISVCPATALITSPASGATYTSPASVTINATATNPSGTISKVEFYQDAVRIATDSTAPYSFAWAGVTPGSYSLSVKAYSGATVVAVSSTVKVTVQALQGIYTWTGAAGGFDWNTPGNWSPNGIPGTNDSVIITTGTNYPRLTTNTAVTDLTILSGTLDLNGQQLTATQIARFTGGHVIDGTLNIQCSEARFSGTVFASTVTLNTACGNIYLDGSVFNGQTSLIKQGPTASDNDGGGGNVFNGPVTIVNNSTYRFRTGDASADNFNNDVIFNNNNAGSLEISYNANTPFAGNITLNSNSVVTFGAGTGGIILDSNRTQSITKTGLDNIIFNRLVVNKTANNITLNDPVRIGSALTLTQGNLLTSTDNKLIFNAGATVSSASNASFVSGPVTRHGLGSFTFPVGKAGQYRPIGINPAGSAATSFTAEYFNAPPPYPTNVQAPIHHISTCGYWILDRTTGSGITPVTLSWDSINCAVVSPADLLVAHETGGQWISEGNGGFTGNYRSGTVVSAVPVSSFSPFTLASTNAADPLPLRWLSFRVTSELNRVALNWSTASEINNRSFDVERSADGVRFHSINFVKAANRVTTNYYVTYDDQPLSGRSFYRIKQTGTDSNISYSKTISADRNSNSFIRLSPNPVTDKATIVRPSGLSGHLVLELVDAMGRRLYDKVLPASASRIDLNFSDYRKGIYILKIKTAEQIIYVQKLIKQ